MRRINNKRLLKKYISKYDINSIFTESLEEHMELIAFEKGEYICREGEPIEYLLFFVKGKAKVYINLENGKNLLLCFYNPFMAFGDLELISMEMASTNTEVVEEVYCIALPLNKVREELIEDSKFLRFICQSLSGKLKRESKNGSINLLYPLESRVASYIVATMEHIKTDEESFQFKENLTAIAELLGTSYRHLLRTLNRMVEAKVLEKIRGGYRVVDEETLREMAADIYR